MNRIYRDGKHKVFLATDLDEAYRLGFFQCSMSTDEMINRITRYNRDIKVCTNATHRGLFDMSKGENGFICGVSRMSTVPKYSLMEYNFSKDKKLQYCNAKGEQTSKETVNQDEHEYKALARGWLATFDIVERKGYRVNKRGL
jgi:hypothetical protein